MLANVSGVRLEDFSAAHWTFAERLFACQIDFRGRLFGFSFLFRFWIALLEFEADIFFVVQNEKCLKRSAFAGNETLKQVRLPVREQFLHLFAFDRPLQDHFARSEIARLVRPDRIFADVGHARFKNASAAFWTRSQWLLCGKIDRLSRAV